MNLDTYLGNINPVMIDYNSNGSVVTPLPNGPSTDSYKLSLFVKIYDDMAAFTTFYIPTPVVVSPNPNFISTLITSTFGKFFINNFTNYLSDSIR